MAATPYPGDCAECGRPLLSYDIRYGWLTLNVGWRTPPARVHTVCRSKFESRPYDERKTLAAKEA